MSFEGYYQLLCKNGHSYTEDARDHSSQFPGDDRPKWFCIECYTALAWENLVDVTNGSYYTDEATGITERIDGFVELEVNAPAKECRCSSCGNVHRTSSTTYKIPQGVGRALPDKH
jgi:hypothetical protein